MKPVREAKGRQGSLPQNLELLPWPGPGLRLCNSVCLVIPPGALDTQPRLCSLTDHGRLWGGEGGEEKRGSPNRLPRPRKRSRDSGPTRRVSARDGWPGGPKRRPRAAATPRPAPRSGGKEPGAPSWCPAPPPVTTPPGTKGSGEQSRETVLTRQPSPQWREAETKKKKKPGQGRRKKALPLAETLPLSPKAAPPLAAHRPRVPPRRPPHASALLATRDSSVSMGDRSWPTSHPLLLLSSSAAGSAWPRAGKATGLPGPPPPPPPSSLRPLALPSPAVRGFLSACPRPGRLARRPVAGKCQVGLARRAQLLGSARRAGLYAVGRGRFAPTRGRGSRRRFGFQASWEGS